jgi:uncharacterized protein (DUF2235 family)
MPKNIVVYSDGTGQDGGARPEQRISNIYKMYRISRDHADTAIDPSQQVVFYDAGLGTDIGTTALTAPVRFVQKLLGSVTGAGIKRNIADCYEFIINHYQPGDRIFLFGFSRGAYTVRSLANLLMLCGVPTKTPAGPVIRFRKAVRDIAWEAVDTVLEHGAGHPRAEFEDERVELARRFQVKYGSGDGSDSNVAPYFIGVFDTVAALGAKGMRLPSMWFALTQPPYGTSMPQSGRRPQHQKQTCPVGYEVVLPLLGDFDPIAGDARFYAINGSWSSARMIRQSCLRSTA